MSIKPKKPTRKPSKPNTLTVDLDKTKNLYRQDKEGGTFAIDPVDNRMTHLDEFDALRISDAAALGFALKELLPSLSFDEPRYENRELFSRAFPFRASQTLQEALVEIGKELSEMDEKSLQKLQLRALKAIATSVFTVNAESLFD